MKLNRRGFIHRVSLGVFTVALGSSAIPRLAHAVALPNDIQRAKDKKNLAGLEKEHTPILKVPLVAEDGRVVPVEMTLDHPMENDHYIESVTFVVIDDPIASKCMYNFTPQSGKPFLKFQTRMDAGTKTVSAIIQCSKHGRWVGDAVMRIVGGGC
ncbi:MAG: thiosulfate oxidation carrier protein SoxY [Nitrospinota bacterium]|nr:thiosulfate oxidation carrier protein SoxY [Nitrospinota bacterium]